MVKVSLLYYFFDIQYDVILTIYGVNHSWSHKYQYKYLTVDCIVFRQLNIRMTLMVSKSTSVCPVSRLYRAYTVRYVVQNTALCIRNIINKYYIILKVLINKDVGRVAQSV